MTRNTRAVSPGRIEVIAGCMFAGKTAALIDRLHLHHACGLRVLAITHRLDVRGGCPSAVLHTHDNRTHPALSLASAVEVRDAAHALNADVVAIDEAQFFDGCIVDVCAALRRASRIVIAAGIHHNAWGRPFEPLPSLMAIADSVEIMTVPCTACGAGAQFTQRVSPVVNGNMVGGPSDYEPRCATCFQPLGSIGVPPVRT